MAVRFACRLRARAGDGKRGWRHHGLSEAELMRRAAEFAFAILLAPAALAGIANAFLNLGAGSNTSASAPSTFIYLPNGTMGTCRMEALYRYAMAVLEADQRRAER